MPKTNPAHMKQVVPSKESLKNSFQKNNTAWMPLLNLIAVTGTGNHLASKESVGCTDRVIEAILLVMGTARHDR